MNKTIEALELAEALENDAKEHREVSYGLDCPPERTANWKHALNCEAAARLIREALTDQFPDATKKIAKPVEQERYFCERCGKRVGDKNGVWEGIHTCTPPADARDCGGAQHA